MQILYKRDRKEIDDEEVKTLLAFILTSVYKYKNENVLQFWRKENGFFFFNKIMRGQSF